MRITSARVTNYKSIIDSGPVPIDESITTMVGRTGSGKTSFLLALAGLGPNRTFKRASSKRIGCGAAFTSGDLAARDIQCFAVTLRIEEADKAASGRFQRIRPGRDFSLLRRPFRSQDFRESREARGHQP